MDAETFAQEEAHGDAPEATSAAWWQRAEFAEDDDAAASPPDPDAPEALDHDADEPDDDADDDPDEADDPDAAYADEAEADEDDDDEDPRAALKAEREARRALEAQWRERADEDARREAERQRAEREAAARKRQWDAQQAWQTYQGEKRRIAQQRLKDAEQVAQTAASGGDGVLLAQHLAALREREEQTADYRYHQWSAQHQAAERQQLIAERDRAAVREYADYVREAYGLPHDDLKRITAYSDGTPVDPNAMAARAAELLEQRRERANLKRQQTRRAREQGRQDVRGRTRATPGSRGRGGAPLPEVEGTLEELETLFPRDRRLRRVV